MRISLQPAFILHRRPYRETSYIIEFLTRDYGRIAAVAKGVRSERSKSRALLQSFVPLMISWQGKNELVALTNAEAQTAPIYLQKNCLLAALYLNELLMRMLHKHDPYPALYALYYQTLLNLQTDTLQQKQLRIFEKKLLEEVGYGLQLTYSLPDKALFTADQYYHFQPDQGFFVGEKTDRAFSGKSIIDLSKETLEDEISLRDAKRIMRMIFADLLGDKPLNSRKLFVSA